MTSNFRSSWLRLIAQVYLLLAIGFFSAGASAQDKVTFFHNDILGSPAIATDADGTVVWKETYLPYGHRLQAQVETANNQLWFAGKQYDPSTGLSYMGARYYIPLVGRFTGFDPKEFSPENPHSFNRYAYANNNPYRYVDPDGKFPDVVWDAFNLSIGFTSLVNNVRAGNWSGAAVDGVGMALDGVAAAIPMMPGGAAAGIAAYRTGNVAAKEAGVIANSIRGRASEARVLNDLGLAKNRTVVSTAEGRSIPDALTDSLSVEVKDAVNVTLTRQLRIQTEAARASGRQSVLITGENTCVSGACSRAFDTIIRRPDLGPR